MQCIVIADVIVIYVHNPILLNFTTPQPTVSHYKQLEILKNTKSKNSKVITNDIHIEIVRINTM